MYGKGCPYIGTQNDGQRVREADETGADQADRQCGWSAGALENNGGKNAGEKTEKRPSHGVFDIFFYTDIDQFPDGVGKIDYADQKQDDTANNDEYFFDCQIRPLETICVNMDD